MIRFVLIGAGTVARVHAVNIAARADCELSVVVDVQAERAHALANEFGGKAMSDVAEALREPVDAVIVASSTSAHAEHVCRALRANLHCLCEKPLTIGLEAAIECLDLAHQKSCVAVMGFNRRYDQNYLALQQQVAAGDIGNVEMMHFASRGTKAPAPETALLSGGMLREKGVHFYDMASWISGAEPVEVYVAGACLVDPQFADYDDVDTAAVTLRLSNGALVTFDFGRRCAYGQDEFVEVFGAQGLLQSGREPSGNVRQFRTNEIGGSGLHHDWHSQFAASYVTELSLFVDAIKGNPVNLPDLGAGVRAQAVAEAAIVSQRSARPVAIENVWR